MKNKYVILKQIIDLYEEYENQEMNLDLLDFVHWMIEKLNDEPELNKKTNSERYSDRMMNQSPVIQGLSGRARFLETISRIARYHEFYTRKALKDFVINTRLEYLFLKVINELGKARKTDLVGLFHLEYTTGMDTIRRLKNNKLLHEIPDENDKRAKLLVLTDNGTKILKEADKRIQEENNMFVAIISDNKWKKAMPSLEELDLIHNNVYQNHSEKSFAELSNLMDSLKYLYK